MWTEQAPHLGEEQIGIARLSEEARTTGLPGASTIFGGGMSGEGHDRDSGRLRVLLQLTGRREAVEPRHGEIHQDK
jgi:hypothetical protein